MSPNGKPKLNNKYENIYIFIRTRRTESSKYSEEKKSKEKE